MDCYPLLFTYREMVEGSDFVAGVVCNGRLLIAKEDGLWHASGVEPGGLSEAGEDPHEALFNFRQAFAHALRVFAQDAQSYTDFEAGLIRFFEHKDLEDEKRWADARQRVQEGAECEAPFKQLPKETAEEPRGVKVLRLDLAKLNALRTVAGTDQVGIANDDLSAVA